MPSLPDLVLTAAFVMASSAAGAADNACANPHSREFDFWIGRWEVTNADGSVAGHNRIEPIVDRCVLQETWSGVSGSAGTSLNFFDTTRGKWRQFWVWREGTTLELEGGLENGAMVLEGNSIEDGQPVSNRITWTDPPGDAVRQVWEVSKDGRKTWTAIFDGTYRPLKTRAAE